MRNQSNFWLCIILSRILYIDVTIVPYIQNVYSTYVVRFVNAWYVVIKTITALRSVMYLIEHLTFCTVQQYHHYSMHRVLFRGTSFYFEMTNEET